MAVPARIRYLWRVIALLERTGSSSDDPRSVRADRERRQRLTRLPVAWIVTGRPDRAVQIEERSAQLSDGTVVPLRVYRPRGTGDRDLPVVLNFHGGGWVSGDARQSEWWCSKVAAGAGIAVVSVDYRLAPEHPFPTPVEDCYAATAWVVDHAEELQVDASRIAVMGDSAGGNLAAAVSLIARDRGGPPIAAQVLIYPCVELVRGFPSEVENAHGPVLTKAAMDLYSRYYRDGSDGTHPYASPLRAEHANLPRALIQTAQHDPLRDQGVAYAAALRAAGVPVRLTNYEHAVHGYASMPGFVPQAHKAVAEVVAELHEVLASTVRPQ